MRGNNEKETGFGGIFAKFTLSISKGKSKNRDKTKNRKSISYNLKIMKIICIGLNYLDHAKELNLPLPEKPLFFMKPETSLLIDNRPFEYPGFSNEINYETELVLKISKEGKNIEINNATDYYNELTLGFDMTARDLQREVMAKGLPWEITKAFDGSAPVGRFIDINDIEDINFIEFMMTVNGKTVQTGVSSNMIFNFNQIISYVSRFVTIKKGDLIFTGTPKGVGKVKKDDLLEAFLQGEKVLETKVV